MHSSHRSPIVRLAQCKQCAAPFGPSFKNLAISSKSISSGGIGSVLLSTQTEL